MAEVRRRLGRAGYPHELVTEALTRLTEQGYLDDEAFARTWVESRDRAHPRGERALRSELLAKGIERHTVDSVLAERATAGEAGERGSATADERAARRLLERHRRALLREPDPTKRRLKAYALLARNGFDPETCRRTAAELAGELEDR